MSRIKNSAGSLVNCLLENNGFDPKDFVIDRKILVPPDTSHLHSSTDGGLYDTRQPDWHSRPPLRKNHTRFHRTINSNAEFKATWRARLYNNYDTVFMTNDGAFLCEKCVKENLSRIMRSIRNRHNDGWRVVAAGTCHGGEAYEEGGLRDGDCAMCDHCNKRLGEVY